MITRVQRSDGSLMRLRGAFTGAALCSVLAFGAMLASPGAAVASMAVEGSSAAVSAQASCTITWRTTENYHGFTAGYSWAWNVVVGPGATGDRVREIQCLVNNHAYYDGPDVAVDGQYGSATTRAVKRLQENWGRGTVDGVVGPETWRALRAA
ncbi:peptidoglycan-binding protein [Streptomyces sp. NBC_01635]|uniref:peptidoglycan-binding domain-containing protein n=1 Tax=Streptomyces sp. NBC_01635 TaxID=2975904 RepID=UPI00386F9D28|nr:peptidoglycan-binding protein [Streptomyces sp. NBC_01635]